MPLLRREKPQMNAPINLRDLLTERGAFARCRVAHSSRAGYTANGDIRPVDHLAVTAEPQYFEVVLPGNRLFGEQK